MIKKLRINLEEEIIDGSEAIVLLALLSDDDQVVGLDQGLPHLPKAVTLRVR